MTMTMTTLFNFGSVRLCNSSCFHQAEVQSWLPIFLRHPVGPVFDSMQVDWDSCCPEMPLNPNYRTARLDDFGWYWMANTSITDIGSFAGPLVPNPWSPRGFDAPLGSSCQWQWRHQIMLILFLGPSRGAGWDPCDTDLGFENLRHLGAATLWRGGFAYAFSNWAGALGGLHLGHLISCLRLCLFTIFVRGWGASLLQLERFLKVYPEVTFVFWWGWWRATHLRGLACL